MTYDAHTRLNWWISVFPRIAGITAIIAGSIVIAGWILENELLKSMHPSLVSMKANTAIAFVLAGLSLFLHSASRSDRQRTAARAVAFLMVLIGLLNVAEYAFNWDAGIDQLLFHEPEGTIGTFSPGRMALNTAISFCLLGFALLMVKRKNRRSNGIPQLLALISGMLGLLGLLAYIYGLSEFSGYAVYTHMALHTAGTFLFLSIGVLCLQPDVGIMNVITSQGSGGFMARRLLLAAVVLPVVLGWITAGGEVWGWYGNQFGNVINATAYTAIAIALVWRIARSLNRTDDERKLAESELLESEIHFKELFNGAPVGYHELDDHGRITQVNETELHMLGFDAMEMQGHFVWKYLDDQEASREAVLANLAGTRPPARGAERLYRRKDGTTIVVLSEDRILRDAFGRTSGIRTTLQDISELKRAQELLQESEERYRTLVQNLAEGVGIVDEEEHFTFANPAADAIFGVPSGNLVGRSLQEFMDPAEFQKMLKQTRERRRGETGSYEIQIIRPDGEKRYLLATVSALVHNDGTFGGSIGIFRDLTERMRAGEALTWEEYLLNALLQNVPDHIYFKDTESRFMRISRALAEVFGLSDPRQAVGKTDSDFFTGEHARLAYEDEQEIIRTGRSLSKEEKETWSDRLDTWVLTTKMPLRDKGGKIIGTFGISRDITERKRAEQEREALIRELTTALENVKTLGGLVPICAHCKKIRDDKGYWNQLEKYLVEHTDAKLTHGLCPDCAKMYFPRDTVKTSPKRD